MKLFTKTSAKVAALGTAATVLMTTTANATATAAGDKLDGFVELQDLGLGFLQGAGGMAFIVLSIIIAVALYTVTQRVTALVVPLIAGLMLSVGFNIATSFGGVSAQVEDFAVVATLTETPS